MVIRYTINEIENVAQQLIADSNYKTWLFTAPMGGGKTTLIKTLAKVLGVKEVATSPTFSIVNEYQATNDTIFHFDLYRLNNEKEAFDMGLDEYFYNNNWCFVEWPQLIETIIPVQFHRITISIIDENTRELKFE